MQKKVTEKYRWYESKIIKLYALLHKKIQKDIEQTIYAGYPREGTLFTLNFMPFYTVWIFFSEYNLMFFFNYSPIIATVVWKTKSALPSAQAPDGH